MKPPNPRTLPLLLLAIPLFSSAQTLKKTTIIPQTSFQNQSIFSAHWDPNYPWGTDHNGAARMAASQIKLDPTNGNGTLTLTAKRVPAGSQKPASHGGKQINIRYLSGTVSAKQHFTVGSVPGSGFDFGGEFRAPVGRGTWPAFWVTGVKGWPPEIDLAEWKGSGKISFNTFNTSSQVRARDVAYPSPEKFHSILVQVRALANGKDVSAKFLLDGAVIETQYGKGFVGQGMYLIIDLQMEGSSGSPGPEQDTLFQVRNLEVSSYN
ncbi:concanavalin A-like lectin/glucanase domain-containing protein [Rhypophila decipiens]|uniref:Concanavalin A-like lectin/glucanase domain-containing protein n=1 Tax=Rhypophila decipiens TaxID=261697 RepID=A0AAN6Y1E6_9PEZI|nr:concanavalin A-like lectin/glucanase domain-containing protein [Rhypophila decipiens]